VIPKPLTRLPGRRVPNPISPILHLWAYDTLVIPAMSVKCERAFSSIKKTITPERNRLHKEIIKASEYLKNWWDRGLIIQRGYAQEGNSCDEYEPQDDKDDNGDL
jgi:hypothetical protein